MSLTDPYSLPLLSDYRDDDIPANGTEASAAEFTGRAITELVDALHVLVGVLAYKDYERKLRTVRGDGPALTERQQEELLDTIREHWVRTAFGHGDEIAARRGRDTWNGVIP